MFRAADDSSIASDARDDVVRQFAEASTGWNAVAVGSSGRPGDELQIYRANLSNCRATVR
jgi:adenylate cyclase